MSLLVAAQKLRNDVGGVTSAKLNDPAPLVREPVRLVTTDLGNIEHIVTGTPGHLVEQVSTALTRATDSLRGPHGGLIPSSLQHAAAAGVTRVDGQELMTVEQRTMTTLQVLRARVAAFLGGRRG